MNAFRGLVALLVAGLSLGACQAPVATFERTMLGDPAKPYLGMTKAQIIACAGTPAGSYATGTGETIIYHYSGAGPVPSAAKSDAPKGHRSVSRNPTRIMTATRASSSRRIIWSG